MKETKKETEKETKKETKKEITEDVRELMTDTRRASCFRCLAPRVFSAGHQ